MWEKGVYPDLICLFTSFLRNHQKEARNAVIGWHSDVNELKRENIWIFRNFKTLNNDDSDRNCWYFHITHMLDTVLNTLYIISLNLQNILGYRYYYHSHFLFKATLGLIEVRCRVRWQRQDLNPGHSAPEFAVHDSWALLSHLISEGATQRRSARLVIRTLKAQAPLHQRDTIRKEGNSKQWWANGKAGPSCTLGRAWARAASGTASWSPLGKDRMPTSCHNVTPGYKAQEFRRAQFCGCSLKCCLHGVELRAT